MTNREPWRVSTKNGLDSRCRVHPPQSVGRSVAMATMITIERWRQINAPGNGLTAGRDVESSAIHGYAGSSKRSSGRIGHRDRLRVG